MDDYSKDLKDSKDPKDYKDLKDSKDSKDSKDPKDYKDPKDPKHFLTRKARHHRAFCYLVFQPLYYFQPTRTPAKPLSGCPPEADGRMPR